MFSTMLSLLTCVKSYAFSKTARQETKEGDGPPADDVLLSLLIQKLQNEGHTDFLEKLGPVFRQLCGANSRTYHHLIVNGAKMWKEAVGGRSDW